MIKRPLAAAAAPKRQKTPVAENPEPTSVISEPPSAAPIEGTTAESCGVATYWNISGAFPCVVIPVQNSATSTVPS